MLTLSPAEQAAREIRLAARSRKLEDAYNESLRTIAIAHEAEASRRLHLTIVMLEQENHDLKEQLWQYEEQIDELHTAQDQLAEESVTNRKTIDTMQTELRTKSRQVDALTAELHSMKGLSSDSSKLLSEKLALSRELSALKPQMEHLQAQITANQNILAEKLSLERELSAIQVELDNEKRASAKARARDSGSSLDTDKVNSQIDQLRSDLAREKRERERAERDYAAKLEEAKGNAKLTESRLEAFRTKLKTTKDQLEEAQEALRERPAKASKADKQRESVEYATTTTGPTRKRSAAQMDPDAALGTPGDHLPVKRGRRISTALAGEKSSFSITPFLNKTGDISADSPAETPSKLGVHSFSAITDVDNSEDAAEPMRKKNLAVKTKTNDGPSLSRSGAKGNNLKAKRSTERLARKSNLDQVDEENDENEEQNIIKPNNATKGAKQGAGTSASEAGKPGIKKKRRLLGKTLFDDDEDNTISRRDDSIFSKSGLSLGAKSFGKAGLSFGSRLSTTQSNSLTSFSPLKKDRSVLAG